MIISIRRIGRFTNINHHAGAIIDFKEFVYENISFDKTVLKRKRILFVYTIHAA